MTTANIAIENCQNAESVLNPVRSEVIADLILHGESLIKPNRVKLFYEEIYVNCCSDVVAHI